MSSTVSLQALDAPWTDIEEKVLIPIRSIIADRQNMSRDVTDEYDAFSSDYHWLYSDRVLSGEPFIEQYADILASLAPGARILDCACGIGVHTLALARHAFSVRGADASPGMVAEAARRAEAEGLGVEFTTCPWVELTSKFDEKFDLVLCYGNAIGHCKDADEMLASLQGMHGVLRQDGTLVIDSRNWEKLLIRQLFSLRPG
jgi:2-polyprenyl-3-methyl-5-hydroxy-6-metoxy-1,4-benzoquinol methylase